MPEEWGVGVGWGGVGCCVWVGVGGGLARVGASTVGWLWFAWGSSKQVSEGVDSARERPERGLWVARGRPDGSESRVFLCGGACRSRGPVRRVNVGPAFRSVFEGRWRGR